MALTSRSIAAGYLLEFIVLLRVVIPLLQPDEDV